MKRMRFFAVIFTILISFVGVFSAPEKASAQQTVPNSSQTDLDAGIYLFDQEIRTVNTATLVADIGADSVAALTKEVMYAKSIFIGLYNYEITSGKTPDEAFTNALNSVQYTISILGENSRHGDSSLALSSSEKNLLNGSKAKQILSEFRGILRSAQPSDYKNLSPDTPNLQVSIAQNNTAVTTGATTSSAAALSNAAAASATANNRNKTIDSNASACSISWTKNLNIGACIDAGAAWIITHTLLAFVGYILWVTATVMNYAIQIGILDFAKWAPDTLYPIWLVIRQIVSLFVVFAGLWLGFMYIINKGDQFKKYIPWVVIFALFVNFSYPLARTVIDISNIASLNIYASAVGSETLLAGNNPITSGKTAGAIIRDRLGLMGLIDFANGDSKYGKEGEGSLNKIDSTPAALLAVIFIGYAAWIFFLISALIITRTAVLIFLIVASPILFIDAVIPKLGEQAENLRKIFFQQLFVGPVFAIMLALTLKFLEVFQAAEGPLSASVNSVQNASGEKAIVMFFNILMMLIMLHIMLKVTKATSGKIGEAVSSAMGKVGGFAVGGVALGGAGMLGRATLGRGAAAMRDSKWMSGMQDKGGIAGFAGKHMFNASNSVATSSFDGRNSAFVKTNAEKIGMKLSTGNSMGFEARMEKDLKDKLNRTNFRDKALRKRDGVLREEYNSIDDPAQKSTFLAKNIKDDKFRNKLIEEDSNKAFMLYKGFEPLGTLQGDKERAQFNEKNKGNTDLLARAKEFDDRLAAQELTKQNAADTTKALNNLVHVLTPKNNNEGNVASPKNNTSSENNTGGTIYKTNPGGVVAVPVVTGGGARLGGGDYQKGMTADQTESEANKTAQEKFVAKAPSYEVGTNQMSIGNPLTANVSAPQSAKDRATNSSVFNVNQVDLSRINTSRGTTPQMTLETKESAEERVNANHSVTEDASAMFV